MTKPIYLVWDAETTGIDVHEDRIVQWFMATADAEGNLLDKWQWFINPGIPVPEEASAVHGLTTEWLQENGQDPKEALNEIRLVFLENLDLIHVAFNMAFDLSILDAEFKRHSVSENFGSYMRDKARLVDAIVIDRHHDKYRKGKRTLEAQAKHYGVPFNPDEAHDAAYDVEATAKVTVKVLEKFGTPTTSEQASWYAEWSRGLQEYLRRSDPDAIVDSEWPLKTKGD
ncbi:DnaQ-like DNA polymerase III subunit [Microbacterium phage LeeroyJenkins]|nr:DnaQ-like DNA polymerase III subunit [Microbacterium phage LeeroyJenkins]